MISSLLFLGSLVFLALFIVSLKKTKKPVESQPQKIIEQQQKQQHGHIQIFYGSQTGTAAKMAESFAQEATEKGWTPQVIDLKDIKIDHFDRQGEISVFFLSNTGEGQTPDNAVKFMKVLKKKQDLDEVRIIDWSTVAFTVFGLGNTQYEFYNKTGIDADALLQTRGAHRIYKLGLGDNNASMEDDYIQWKNDIWEVLANYRREHALQEAKNVEIKSQQHASQNKEENSEQIKRKYLSETVPQLANFRFYICERQSQQLQFTDDDLDFKTKASLKSQFSTVRAIKEVRQNTNDGSTLQLEISLENNPVYETAGNIGLYPRNDPKIIERIINYFGFTKEQLQSYVSVEKVNEEKKLKLNFIPYCKLIDLIESHIDVQGRLTKSVLKKLSKFPSNDKDYFVANSSPKTTAEFKRITEETSDPKGWYYLFRIIDEKQVKIGFEDFVELSDSIAPRLFTIGSSYKKQQNVVVMASIIEQGLISKFFNSKPQGMKAELRKSSFNDAMKWKKVIFISVGTGFAPFRGYLQEKEVLVQKQKNGEQVTYPRVTLFFGCKRSTGDFIYKDEIQNWVQKQVINVFHGAFSREKEEKVYVQHLLSKHQQEIHEYMYEQNSAIYICGSLSMGHEVSEVLAQKAGGHEKIKQLQLKGRIIKQLW